MKRSLLFSLVFSLLATITYGQQNQYAQAGDSDPEARAILEKVKTKYEAYKSIEASFTLSIELPEQPAEEQNGKLIQQGDQYRLDLAAQQIICDGKTIWLYLKQNKEVQINNFEADEDAGFLSPRDLLRVYEREDFVYVLVNEYSEDGKILQDIEFKPLDSMSEYSKLRVSIEKNTSQIKRIRAFAKDGSRYALTLNTFKSDQSYPSGTFVWNKSECPDCYVEDLRID